MRRDRHEEATRVYSTRCGRGGEVSDYYRAPLSLYINCYYYKKNNNNNKKMKTEIIMYIHAHRIIIVIIMYN